MHRAVFLDRDNTLVDDSEGYLSDPRKVRLLPGVADALRRLADAGYLLIVVTNQSGIARGYYTIKAYEQVNEELARQLASHGVKLDAIYYCPYHRDGTVEPYIGDSEERKPNPGMLLRAARDLDIDLQASWMIGDTLSDMQAGRRAGCHTVFVPVGPGQLDQLPPDTDHAATDMTQAAELILTTTEQA